MRGRWHVRVRTPMNTLIPVLLLVVVGLLFWVLPFGGYDTNPALRALMLIVVVSTVIFAVVQLARSGTATIEDGMLSLQGAYRARVFPLFEVERLSIDGLEDAPSLVHADCVVVHLKGDRTVRMWDLAQSSYARGHDRDLAWLAEQVNSALRSGRHAAG